MSDFKMSTPKGEGKEKLSTVQLLPQGPHPCICYQLIDFGQQWKVSPKYGDKWQREILIGFEFPLFQQQFYENEPVKPTVVSVQNSFVISEGSNLRKLVEQLVGRPLQKSEYVGFNIGQILNKVFVASIVHVTSKKDTNVVYANIGSISPVTESSKQAYNFDWTKVVNVNPTVGFSVDDAGECFKTPAFGNLYAWQQDKLKGSKEGKAFVANGGVFYEKPKDVGGPAQHNTFVDSAQQPVAQPQGTQQQAPPVANAPAQQLEDPNQFI